MYGQTNDILFDRAIDGIVLLSLDGKLVSVNESFADMHGYSVNETRLMGLKDLDTPEASQKVSERMARLLIGEPQKFEVEHYHKDGHIFPLEVSASLIAFSGGTYIQCFYRDISERRKAEEKIKSLSKFPSENPDPMLRINSDTTVVYMNRPVSLQLKEQGLLVY